MKSSSSLPERCTYTIPTPTCQLGTSCPYAHSEDERRDLILRLLDYDKTTPRPIPRADKLLPYVLCENHKSDKKSFNGECAYGRICKMAHSQQELDAWEAQREAEEAKMVAVRPFDASESKLELCASRRRCRGVHCPYAHSEMELAEWTRQCKHLLENQSMFLSSHVCY